MAKLFEYAIILNEKRDNNTDEITSPAELLVEPTRVLCSDDKQAAMIAARAIPEDQLVNLERIDVVVRPF